MAEKEKDELEKMNEALSMSEQFVEKYQKPLLWGLLIVVVVIGAILGVRHFYLLPREDKAQAAMYQAVMAFENDSLDLAINGNEKFDGLLTVADQYGSTDAGNLANAYLGLAYYEKGEYETAQKYLAKFSADESVLAPAMTAAIGNCLVDMDKYEESVSYFEKAAKASDNDVFSPVYLKKAAAVYEKLGNQEAALKLYQEIKDKYPTSNEARSIDRYIERIQNK
ncbi:MAG TPA: tetratricopeptide repeat protein [Candidatus Barnesiella merdipullorum]|nr:tetratricopeptide repeat protein [Candidatus Barnesiella merdipullorum]